MKPCRECGFDGGRLSPADAAVAARSFPRRYRAAIARRDDEDSVDALIRRRPPDGDRSALELVADAAAALRDGAEDIRRVLVTDTPEVGAPAAPAPPGSVDDALSALEGAASRLAEVLETGQGAEWTRTAISPSGPVSALELAAHAIHDGVHNLRRIDAVLQQLRGRPA